MKGELKIQVEPRPDQAAQMALEGSVDGHTYERLRQAVDEMVEGGTLWVVLDLSRMDYVASVGLNLLVNARVSRRNAGGDLIIVRPQPQVMKILKMLGLTEILLLAATPEEAWASIRSRRSSPEEGAAGLPLIE
ncbi:MAG TPA: STAS domain-containing protein [Planctomycetota bacterium]|nr:STAS domain-containing protein [Planctomycetota bacterium]